MLVYKSCAAAISLALAVLVAAKSFHGSVRSMRADRFPHIAVFLGAAFLTVAFTLDERLNRRKAAIALAGLVTLLCAVRLFYGRIW